MIEERETHTDNIAPPELFRGPTVYTERKEYMNMKVSHDIKGHAAPTRDHQHTLIHTHTHTHTLSLSLSLSSLEIVHYFW